MKNYKYRVLKNNLMEQIRSGKMRPGEKLMPELDLQKETGLSRNTVRQAIHELVQEGFLISIQGKGNFIRYANSSRSRQIALIIHDMTNIVHPITSKLIMGLDSVLSPAGYCVNIFSNNSSFVREEFPLYAKNYAAVILSTYGVERNFIDAIQKYSIPCICAKLYLPETNIPSVRINFQKAGALAAEHLRDCGCRSLGVVCPDDSSGIITASEFYRGICSVALENGLMLKSENCWRIKDFRLPPAQNVLDEILHASLPDGIVVACDSIARILMQELMKCGIRIPDDLMITGCNNMDFSRLLNPALTTFEIPTDLAGVKTGEALLRMLNGEVVESCVLDPELIVRGSTRKTDSSDESVKRY